MKRLHLRGAPGEEAEAVEDAGRAPAAHVGLITPLQAHVLRSAGAARGEAGSARARAKGEGGVACLQALLPNFDEIDPWEGFSVHLNTINGTIHEIEIYGDNGLIELTLIPNPIEWN